MILLTEANRNNKYTLNNSKYFNLLNKFRNFIIYRYDYYYSEYKKFKDYYIRYYYKHNKLKNMTYYNYSGEFHREDGPAWISYYYDDGEINYTEYYLNGKTYSYMDYILEIKK